MQDLTASTAENNLMFKSGICCWTPSSTNFQHLVLTKSWKEHFCFFQSHYTIYWHKKKWSCLSNLKCSQYKSSSVQTPLLIGSWEWGGGHERWFGRDPLPVFSAGRFMWVEKKSIHPPLSKSATSWSPSLTRSNGVWPSRFFLLASAPCWQSERVTWKTTRSNVNDNSSV